MSNKLITKAEKNQLKRDLLDQLIPKYELGKLKIDIDLCTNPNKTNALALHKLLEIEITKLNSQVNKKINRLDYVGTID